MPMLDDMIVRLNQRIANASAPFPQFVYLADVHYDITKSNSGFEKILTQISAEKDWTLFILIGGDLVNSGSNANYTAFRNRCNAYYQQTGIPIIPTMGNHEFYSVPASIDEIAQYRNYMGAINFPLELPQKALGDSLTVVAFDDAKPHKLQKISYPDISNHCVTKQNTIHLFYFPFNYIHLNPLAPNMFSHFPDYLDNAQGNHILVTSHVPPRKDPLPAMLNNFVQSEYSACLKVNPVISMSNLKTYYRNLWMLVQGNSTADKNDSTQWYADEIKNRTKVELLLAGHVHTYFPFRLAEANHDLQIVISGGGGNSSASTYDPVYPVTKYHYLKISYSPNQNRFVYTKVDAGN